MLRCTFFICLLFSFHTQAQRLNGTVSSKYGSVVPNIQVSIAGVDQSITEHTGEFQLNLETCKHCKPGNEVTFILFNDEYGFHKIRKTINQTFSVYFEIERKPNNYGITGVVKDAKTQEFIPGINVKLITAEFADKVPAVKTDEHGLFVIFLRRDVIGTNKYLEFLVKDEQSKYRDKRVTKNLSSPFDLYMEKGGEVHHLRVNTFIRTNIHVKSGDLIKIFATGNIKVGPWVGHSDPDGRSSGFAGADLSFYNIVQTLNHAALLYRFSGEGASDWKFAGKQMEFYAQQNGFLEFQVNDNDQGNNSGAYELKVIVQ